MKVTLPLHSTLQTIIFAGLLIAGHYVLAPQSTDAQSLPPLAFTMTRASDGKTVTAADYKGKVVLIYFGYTFCPDICPTTLLNVSTILKSLGKEADHVRVLFVTIDPNRDTLPVLKRYTEAFAPQVVGLRGTPQQLAALARRYHASYSVTPSHNGKPYEVTHSAAIYVFDAHGSNMLMFIGLAALHSKLEPIADYLRKLIVQTSNMDERPHDSTSPLKIAQPRS
jgi:protein SCO1